ncbi:ABC transporter permease subunit [Fontisphaera persica]|uniref:ABC transporter permease subunit n=1 Tax=Fontisphaera persica TaxID=2974023 RepID=UPI0024BFFF95|nr:ABC transporter permease subunit [Fontisphaera persica]WCJ58530.1 ABC transporter permease subunit [Fontisphaera persica]
MNLAEALHNIQCIGRRQLGSYFNSPVAYVFIVIFLLLAGFFTFMVGGFFQRDQASLVAFFMWHPWLFLVLVPAVGMGLWAEERRLGTMELLLTMPVTAWQAIVGKFLAAWVFLAVTLALTFPVWITVNYLGEPDNGVIVCSYIGSLLMAGACLSISTMTSALTRNQVVSFIISIVIILLLILAGFPPVTELLKSWDVPAGLISLIASTSIMTHFEGFQKGVLDLRDVVYFLSVMGFCLFTTGVIIRSLRSGH